MHGVYAVERLPLSSGAQTMPADWMWPYQLNQYELPFTNASHRLAWGSNYGAIGQATTTAFGRTFPGHPQVRSTRRARR